MRPPAPTMQPYAVVLGIAQDGGHPHPGCRRACCMDAYANPALAHRAACVGIVDPGSGEAWLLDATPDLPAQLHQLITLEAPDLSLSGILLTHAHIGQWIGWPLLGELGAEVLSHPF